MTTPMSAEELQRYAETIVRGGIAARRGDSIVVNANLGSRELAVALAEASYGLGAVAVDVLYDDARVFAAKIEHGPKEALGHETPWRAALARTLGEERVAMIQIAGEYELDAVAGLDPERVAADNRRNTGVLARIRREGRLRATICAWPTAEWAQRVFPGVAAEQAQRRLAEDLLSFCRIGPGDPPGHNGWTEHLAALRRRAARLTKLDLKEVHVVDEGTDLRCAIAPHSMWRGGGEKDFWGRQIAMNIPTEECFISPDAAATEGVFRCSRPRSFGGRLIEELSGEFRGGRLVRLEAKSEDDRDWLARFFAATPGADRVGEIALVDSSSRIGQTGRTYYSALLDENAAAHFAFGSGYAKTRTVPIGRKRFGVNRSRTHVDVMVGTDALNAWGITQAGKRVALVRDGAWQF